MDVSSVINVAIVIYRVHKASKLHEGNNDVGVRRIRRCEGERVAGVRKGGCIVTLKV